MKYTVLCLVNVILLATGQIVFKHGAKDKIIDSVPAAISVLFSPVVLVGLALYASATMLWLYILSRVPLSFAYPIQALAFPLVLVLSLLVFRETVPATRWIGLVIILIGVFIAAR